MDSMEKNEIIEDLKTDGERIYELSFLFVSALDEDKVKNEFEKIKESLKKKKAVFISEEMPRFINLAYEISKVVANKRQKSKDAYFGWIKFELDPASLLEIKEEITNDINIIRFLVVKTVKEDTMKKPIVTYGLNKRSTDQPQNLEDVFVEKKIEEIVAEVEKAEVKEEINKEEIDKKLEELANI